MRLPFSDPVQAILQELWVAALQKGSELAVFPGRIIPEMKRTITKIMKAIRRIQSADRIMANKKILDIQKEKQLLMIHR